MALTPHWEIKTGGEGEGRKVREGGKRGDQREGKTVKQRDRGTDGGEEEAECVCLYQGSGSVHGTELRALTTETELRQEAEWTGTTSVITFLIGKNDPTLTAAVLSSWLEV